MSRPVSLSTATSDNRPQTGVSAISSQITEGDDASRPHSSVSTLPTQSQPPPSRRGGPPVSNAGRSSVGVSSIPPSSRPQSAASRGSRSHIPSMAAQGFFRPMSSRRLQAQRGARPGTTGLYGQSVTSDSEGQSDAASQPRQSMSTAHREANEEAPPPSRGTEYTDPPPIDRTISNASPTGNTTIRSLGESVRLLHNRTTNHTPRHLDLGQNFKQGVAQDPPQKSPRSFRSGFSLAGKTKAQQDLEGQGHIKLPSHASSPRYQDRKPSLTPAVKPDLGRNHEYFRGNNVFFLGGRLQNSRDRPINIATAFFVILPAILFFVFSAPWLWHNVSPAVPILFAYLFFICMSSFVHASVVDPGIFPRNLHQFPPNEESQDPLALGPPTNDWVMIKLATSATAAMDVPVKFCKTCNIWRPPRTYHCRICDNCVETLDHHCVWLNNCVGRRNYRYFFAFVSSGTLIGLYLIAATLGHCLAYKKKHNTTFAHALNECRVPFALFVYGILATPYPGSLLFYHLFLVGKGESTREYLNSHKFVKAERHRPFTQGSFLKNWIAVLARPRPPTYLHFKRKYEEGDQRLDTLRGPKARREAEEARLGGMEMKPVPGVKGFQGPSGRLKDPGAAGE